MPDKGETTTLTPATSKSRSLRTTIPAGIVRQFKLTEGSKLNWEIEARGKGEMVIVVTPMKTPEE